MFNETLDFSKYKKLGLNYYGAKKLIAPSEDFTELLSVKKWNFGGNNGVRYEKIFVLKDSENERQTI